MFNRDMAEDWVNEDERKKKEKEEQEEWLENATDEEMIDKEPNFFFMFRTDIGLDPIPIWSYAKDWEEQEKRMPNETAEQYKNRAFPPEYLKKIHEEKKKTIEESQAKREGENKQKKLRKKRDLVNDLKRLIEENQAELEELRAKNTEGFSEYQKEHHQSKIDYCEEVIPIYKARLTDSNYLDLYWDELSQ